MEDQVDSIDGPIRYRRQIRVGHVMSRHHTGSTRIARPNDFEVQWEDWVGSLADLRCRRTYLPYCIDWSSERLLLTGIENDLTDLSSQFLYAQQRAQTNHVAAVPLEILEVKDDWRRHPVTVVISIGRCGSTLLSAIARSLSVTCISEPDVFTNLAFFDPGQELLVPPGSIEPLVSICTELLSAPFGSGPFIIKLRGRCTAITRQVVSAIPHANYVFVMREPVSWARSNIRAFSESPEFLVQTLLQALTAYSDLVSSGARLHLLWYEDFCQEMTACLEAAFPWIPPTASTMASLAAAAAADSQQGSVLARSQLADRPPNDGRLAEFVAAWQCARPAQLIRDLGMDGRL